MESTIFEHSTTIREKFYSAEPRRLRRIGENITLIGMPGSGKTTIGMLLSRAFDADFIDIDAGIEASTGESIARTFESKGEEYFRDIESEYVQKAAVKTGVIISTGGGVVLRQENMDTLRNCGVVLFIDRDIKQIMAEDLSDRPLVENDSNALHRLYDERIGLYKKSCDLRVENRMSSEQTAGEAAEGVTALRRRGGDRRMLVINGPNINMLGARDKSKYGELDYYELCRRISSFALSRGIYAEIVQSNHEGDIITAIQKAYGEYDGIVINPGALTHYSHAVADAVECCRLPVIEAHLSNIHGREDFRRTSVIAGRCMGQISGLGAESYTAALRILADSSSPPRL